MIVNIVILQSQYLPSFFLIIQLNHTVDFIMSYMSSVDSNKIFQSIRSSDNSVAKALSQGVINDIQELLDTQNSTLLHVAANSNNYEMAQFYLKAYNQLIQTKPNKYTQQTKTQWLKARDNQGFSCLHYAVFRANYKMVILLEKNGADIYQINNQGLTVLHIAAQGDSPLLMYYFLNKGLKISVTDSKGSTPLHWACYSGMEHSAYALISWGAQIDKQQSTFGMTPLHLAVMSGNGRIVKKLLIKGCDRNIVSYNGKLPLDIAKQNEYKNIADMIIDKQGFEELLNIKTPFRKLQKHSFPFYLLIFLFLSSYILNVSFVLYKSAKYRFDLTITFLALGFLVIIFFLITKYLSPGFLKSSGSSNMFQILLKAKSYEICFDCKLIKPQRSRHCEICETCICVYDHHCPWIGSCIGAGNYWAFYTFLIILLVHMVFTIAFQIINFINIPSQHIFSPLDIIQLVCQIYSLVLSGLFLLPLIFLVIVQTRNTFENKTTFERYGFQKTTSSSTNSVQNSERKQSVEDIKGQDASSVSHELKIKLLEHMPSESNVSKLSKPKKIEQQEIFESQESKLTNCYLMCFGNKKKIKYSIAV